MTEVSVDAPVCEDCGHQKDYVDCWNCGAEGYIDSSEYRDYDGPEPYWQACQICRGDGGYYVCCYCNPEAEGCA